MKLRQETTVREYRRQFEQFSVGLKDMGDKALESKFIRRIKEDI